MVLPLTPPTPDDASPVITPVRAPATSVLGLGREEPGLLFLHRRRRRRAEHT